MKNRNREKLGNDPNPQVAIQRWGRRFRLPRPRAGDFPTASEGAIALKLEIAT
jgi:hypothetical protein